jgi:hypothetical protein
MPPLMSTEKLQEYKFAVIQFIKEFVTDPKKLIEFIEKEGLKRNKKWLIDFDSNNNKHFDYLVQYLDAIKIKTIVLEIGYYDRQFIEDYSKYYCRSFKHYSKKCLRLHFFSEQFDEPIFNRYLCEYNIKEKKEHENIYNSYRGFSVIKPIPLTIFGRTCLSTYSENPLDATDSKFGKGTRNYTTTREYNVHLFGIEYNFKSVAFQEQDNQVFVCATTALWVAFQCTSKLFDHTIPTPYDITLLAIERKTPNIYEGLTDKQMVNVISEVGLHPLLLTPGTISYAKAVLYAYLKCKIPVILGVSIYDTEEHDEDIDQYFDNCPAHAITTLGYDMIDKDCPTFVCPKDKDEEDVHSPLHFKSSCIEQVYVHDDGIGAFARLLFDDEIEDTEDRVIKKVDFKNLPLVEFNEKYKGKKDTTRFRLSKIIIPLYHKIRIRFEKIFDLVKFFNSYALQFNKDLQLDKEINYIWDVYLTTTCEFKAKLRRKDIYPQLNDDIRLQILTTNLPKYIWVADAYYNNELNFSLYFDATDMENSDFFLFPLHSNIFSYAAIKENINEAINPSKEEHRNVSYLHKYKNKIYQLNQIVDFYDIPFDINSLNCDELSKLDLKYIIKMYYENP